MIPPTLFTPKAVRWWNNNFVAVGLREGGSRRDLVNKIGLAIDNAKNRKNIAQFICISGGRGIGKTSIVSLAAGMAGHANAPEEISAHKHCKESVEQVQGNSFILLIRFAKNNVEDLECLLNGVIRKFVEARAQTRPKHSAIIIFECNNEPEENFIERLTKGFLDLPDSGSARPGQFDTHKPVKSKLTPYDTQYTDSLRVEVLNDAEVDELIGADSLKINKQDAPVSFGPVSWEKYVFEPPYDKGKMAGLAKEWAGRHPYLLHRVCEKVYRKNTPFHTFLSLLLPLEKVVGKELTELRNDFALGDPVAEAILDEVQVYIKEETVDKTRLSALGLFHNDKPVKLCDQNYRHENYQKNYSLNFNIRRNKMDPQLIFLAGLQVAYWLWAGVVQPTTVRFGEKVADALGDVVAADIRDWYDFDKKNSPVQNDKFDESQAQQERFEKIVIPKIRSSPAKADRLIQDIQKMAVSLLRDSNSFDMDELNILWMDILDPAVDWKTKVIASPSQASIAGDLVRHATQQNKLACLILAMRKLRKK